MSEISPYRDKRGDFFREYFDSGLPYKDYIATGSEGEQGKWSSFEKAISLNSSQVETIQSFRRQMNILVMSGIWCGDCARQGPMFEKIEDASSCLTFRFQDNRSNPELMEELRINGAQKVPVVVLLSEDFYELSRFGDRHLSVYRRKAENELGAACDAGIVPPSSEELSEEVDEWVAYFERLQIMLRLAPALRKRYGD